MDWSEVQAELDKVSIVRARRARVPWVYVQHYSYYDYQVPVFALVNAGQEPCGLPVPKFFIDPADAEAALASDLSASRGLKGAEAALAADVLSGVRVQPVGLGSAFNLVRQEKALFVPQAFDLRAAEGLEGGEQIEGGLPLIGCYQMRLPSKEGKPMTPLFLGMAEAKTARARAAEAMGMPVEELPLVIVTLQKMVELMMDGQLRDPRAMAFVPTRRAVDYCNQAR